MSYTFNQLSNKAKLFALSMFNKYNNPKGKDGNIELLKSYWMFKNNGELYNPLTK